MLASFNRQGGLYSLVLLIILNTLSNAQSSPLIGSQNEDQDYFIHFIEDVINRHRLEHISNPLQSFCLPVQTDIDGIIEKACLELQEAIDKDDEQSERLKRGLASAINLKQLPEETTSSSNETLNNLRALGKATDSEHPELLLQKKPTNLTPKLPYKKHKFQPMAIHGLADLLVDDDEKNKHIVHREVNINDVLNGLNLMPPKELAYLNEAIGQVNPRISRKKRGVLETFKIVGEKVSKNEGMIRLLKQVARFGVMLLDHLFASPKFILSLPVVGVHVKKLRDMGEPFYAAVELVRHSSVLYKLTNCLHLIKNEAEECSDLDNEKIEAAKRVVSTVGARAIQQVAPKIFKSFSMGQDSQSTNEFISRSIYAIVTIFAPMSRGGCAF